MYNFGFRSSKESEKLIPKPACQVLWGCLSPITHWDIQKSSLGLGLSWLWPLDGLVGSSLKAWLLVDLGWPTNALSVVISSAGYQRVVAAIKILGLSYEYRSIFE